MKQVVICLLLIVGAAFLGFRQGRINERQAQMAVQAVVSQKLIEAERLRAQAEMDLTTLKEKLDVEAAADPDAGRPALSFGSVSRLNQIR